MIPLLAAGAAAQVLDAVTMGFERELNPLVLHLGTDAYLAKILLIVFVVSLAWALLRLPADFPQLDPFRRAFAKSLAVLMLVIGVVGTWSNL